MRVRPFATTLLVLLIAFSAACASGGAAGGGGGGGGGSANQVTATELAAAAQNAGEPLRETIQKIRPQWLVVRTGQPSPIVFIDGVNSGELNILQTITTGRVDRVAYVRPEAAASRFGSGFEGGAIEVFLKR
jgi:hypothetical protein